MASAMIVTAAANAVSLAPGASTALFGATAATRPELGGTVLVDTLRPFAIDLGGGSFITGTVQDRVVRENGSGTLDFYYRLFNDTTSAGALGIVTRENYSGYATDADFRLDGLGATGPGGASRSTGSDVWFGFLADPVTPGQSSRFFFIKTDATVYDAAGKGSLVGLNTAGGFGVTSFSTFEPVPLPSAFWLFGSGLLALVATNKELVGRLVNHRDRGRRC